MKMSNDAGSGTGADLDTVAPCSATKVPGADRQSHTASKCRLPGKAFFSYPLQNE